MVAYGEQRSCHWDELHEVFGHALFELIVEHIIQGDLHDVQMTADQWRDVISQASRLIRAAPDLLAACEHVLAVDEPDMHDEHLRDVEMEIIEDAVAKTKGGR